MNVSKPKMLPVAIMAHNEEKVIRHAVESALGQTTPAGYGIRVVVVANACTDMTEDVVYKMKEQYPGRVQLVSIKQKGKTRAINAAIKLFEKMSENGVEIPYVIFLDADCEFMGCDALMSFVERFESNLSLCAISANLVPDVCFNERKDAVSEVYRAIYSLARSARINSISGMCYGIGLDVLSKMDFPDFQLAEDMYVSSRLNGRFYKDMTINVVFKTPTDMHTEINRRRRQEVSSRRYREYYSHLKRKGIRVELYQQSLGDNYRWGQVRGSSFFKAWLHLNSRKLQFYAIIYLLIRLLAKINAYRKIRELRKKQDLDYWQVNR